MSDFLTRLIQKTQGTASLAQPLVVSRFAKPLAQEAAVTPEFLTEAPQDVPCAPTASGKPQGQRIGRQRIAPPSRPGSERHDLSPSLTEFRPDFPERPIGAEDLGLFEPLEDRPSLLKEGRDDGQSQPTGATLTGAVPMQMRLFAERASKPPGAVAAAATSGLDVPEPLLIPQPPTPAFQRPVAAADNGAQEAENERLARKGGADVLTPSPRLSLYQPKGNRDAPFRQSSRYLEDDVSMANQVEPPPVQVTIGRVEVRAVLAPPPQPRAVPPRTPKLSLEDYLRQGREGKR